MWRGLAIVAAGDVGSLEEGGVHMRGGARGSEREGPEKGRIASGISERVRRETESGAGGGRERRRRGERRLRTYLLGLEGVNFVYFLLEPLLEEGLVIVVPILASRALLYCTVNSLCEKLERTREKERDLKQLF